MCGGGITCGLDHDGVVRRYAASLRLATSSRTTRSTPPHTSPGSSPSSRPKWIHSQRVIGWFAGGLWCAVIARWLWIHFGRELGELPGLVWGGVLLVVLALVARRREAA